MNQGEDWGRRVPVARLKSAARPQLRKLWLDLLHQAGSNGLPAKNITRLSFFSNPNMLIPLTTDAPIYHFPKATILLIVVNVICFWATGFADPDRTMPWVMMFGTINPVQWLTSMFAHAGWTHLMGNMFFLWAFGLVVEGKLGFRGMLAIYLSVGLCQSAIVQLIMLPADSGGCLGASGAIMGLMAICFVWAPKNEFNTLVIFIRIWIVDISIYWYCLLCVIEELIIFFVLDAGQMGTSALHLLGAFTGFGVASLYLKKGWVNCENWDLYRVIAGTYGPYANPETTVGIHADPTLMFGTTDVVIKNSDPHSSKRAEKKSLLRRVNELVDSNQFIEAAEIMFDVRMKDSNAALKQSRLKKLALGLIQANMPDEAEMHLEEFVERFPEECDWARIRLAQISLVVNKRPRAAIGYLQGIKLSQLSASQTNLAKKLAATAKKQIREGVEDAEMEW